jgi:hypothetical protein
MNFRHITPLDYPELKPFIQNQEYGLCYYSLPSILTWSNGFYRPFGAVDGDTLLVSTEYETRKEERYLLLPLSPGRDFSPEDLRDLAVSLGFEKYRHVSEEYMERYDRRRIEAAFDIGEQAPYEDYLYLVEDLAELKGNKYSKKRNLINQFRREYVLKDRIEIEEITPASLDECVVFLHRQSEQSNRDIDTDEDLICEKEAITHHIRHMDVLETPGVLLRINGEIAAFGIAAHVTDEIGALHYEKAYPGIKGLYQYFDNLCAKELFKGYKYINRESDMGDPGLLRSKKSYYPVKRIKSFSLEVR